GGALELELGAGLWRDARADVVQSRLLACERPDLHVVEGAVAVGGGRSHDLVRRVPIERHRLARQELAAADEDVGVGTACRDAQADEGVGGEGDQGRESGRLVPWTRFSVYGR